MFLGLIAALSMGGCGGDSVSPTASTPAVSSTASSPATASNDPAPQPATEPTPEPDASGGKGVTAKFLLPSLDLEVTSTNTGHSNTGVVCATDGFQGPNLPGTPYPWHVEAKSTSVTPFPKAQIAAALDWPEDPEVCEQTINVQMDAFRGETCEGHNLAVVWPQDNPVTFEREPGEWVWGKEIRTNAEEPWSECVSREEYEGAGLDVGPDTPAEGCFRWRLATFAATATRSCSAATQSRTRSYFEYERCDCPVVCKEWYPGSLPDEGRGRITFMSKLPDGRYLWRIQNNTGFDNVTLSGPGLEETLFVQSGTIAAHITDQPYYGVSLNLCDGTRVHGTASANENVETWCEVPQAPPGECPLGLCFYEIRGAEEGTEGEVCEDAQGQWMRWGPSEKVQCVFDVPGILRSDFRLTPGQSDPACYKYTGR
jgi:hypothetical protein